MCVCGVCWPHFFQPANPFECCPPIMAVQLCMEDCMEEQLNKIALRLTGIALVLFSDLDWFGFVRFGLVFGLVLGLDTLVWSASALCD